MARRALLLVAVAAATCIFGAAKATESPADAARGVGGPNVDLASKVETQYFVHWRLNGESRVYKEGPYSLARASERKAQLIRNPRVASVDLVPVND